MQKTLTIRLLPSESASEGQIRSRIAETAGCPISDLSGYLILKRSLDARGRQPWILVTVRAFIRELFVTPELYSPQFKDVARAEHTVVVIGAGPAGLFAALKLLESGIRPILLERGKSIRDRRRDLAKLNREGTVDPDSNYCFGEGGAGTYSDGKLYTRSNKRGDIHRILSLLVYFGAEENILYEAHPHIGTNKLPGIISRIRNKILDCGGQFIFGERVTDFDIASDRMVAARTAAGSRYPADAFVLATGHSARDIFSLLQGKGIQLEAKPFALGVRVEHPQELVNSIQYHASIDKVALPPASYSLAEQVNGRGAFSFCMCPGGIIAPTATAPDELVVNGWSPSRRNNPFANSGMVVSVTLEDLSRLAGFGALAGMELQKEVERRAYVAGGGRQVAPAQRLVDFADGKDSVSLPGCSYIPGLRSVPLGEILPGFIWNALRKAFVLFGKKMKGFYTNDAVVVAVESRTSSPVRIPRQGDSFAHPQIRNFCPCGEGAGYAGGIMSAAMDGERVANQLAISISK
jgi:uncharacterized FAD-dependent dehydrogenase